MLEKLFKKVPIGTDITIMNTMYQYGKKDENGIRQPDFIAIVYKYNDTGKKDHIIIKNPKYSYYKLKPGINADYNRLFISEDKVDKIEVKYSELEKSIANELDRRADYNDAISSGDRKAIKKLHYDPRVFNSDQSIEDHYRFEFSKYYPNNITKLTKAFYDIEVDNRYLVSSDFPEPSLAECPINAISCLDESHNIVNTYLLRNSNNPQIEQFEHDYLSGKYGSNYIYKFVENAIGGHKQMIRNKLENIVFSIHFYDYELDLLRDFFSTVYEYSPDFIEGWNSSAFDMEYIINRIAKLGEDPAMFMSDHTWEFPFLYNYIDSKHINEFAERGDYTRLASNTVWLDQMIQFCSRRKAKMGSFTSFKLDDIAWMVAKVHKYDYSSITNNLGELPYLNYQIFVLYNIIDTISNKCIENHTQDLEYIFAKCITNCTTYQKGHRQTVYLINRIGKEIYNLPEKYIIGNNINKSNVKPEKFQGAIVLDPLTVSNYSKQKTADGNYIMAVDNNVDFDYKSLYPSLTIENNCAPNTQIGLVVIWNTWRVIYYPKGKNSKEQLECYIKDPGDARNFPYTKIDDKKVFKKVDVYADRKYTQYIDRVEYDPSKFKTLEYKKIYKEENSSGNDKYSRGGYFIEDMVTDNLISYMHRWFGFADIKEFLEDWNEYNHKYLRCFNSINSYFRFNYISNDIGVIETPIRDMGHKTAETVFYKSEITKPFIDLTPMKGFVNIDGYDASKFNGHY
jgi:hypothetical protein